MHKENTYCDISDNCKLLKEKNIELKKLERVFNKINIFVNNSCIMNDCSEKPTCSSCNCIDDTLAIRRIAEILKDIKKKGEN